MAHPEFSRLSTQDTRLCWQEAFQSVLASRQQLKLYNRVWNFPGKGQEAGTE